MGILNTLKVWAGRSRKEPIRDTAVYAKLQQIFGNQDQYRARIKRTPQNLRYFSRTTYARAAIRRIRDPLQSLQWQIAPKRGLKTNAELERQIQIATQCLLHPNRDDSWRSFIGQIIEDWLTFGAGVFEQQVGSDPVRPLWLWPVDAQSIQIFPLWDGDKNEPRYLQTLGYSNVGTNEGRNLLNDEIVYIKANDSTETPYGYGCMEVAFNSINRLLGVADYAGDLTSNAQPQNLIFLNGFTSEQINAFRGYFRDEVEGRGVTPIIGGNGKPEVLKLHTGGDDGLYLKYQEFIIREVATAFGLSPQNLGIEADVNRSTAEVAADRDWDNTIIPLAELVGSYITREVLHAKLGWYQLDFVFNGLYRQDEESTAKIYETYYKNNMITPNEQREKLGLPLSDNYWADLTFGDFQIAMSGARGAAIIDDPDINSDQASKPKAQKKAKKIPKNLKENQKQSP